MTQEEKVRAYNEALERARNIHKDAVDMENSMLIKTCEVIFPELKESESEDERIRKAIIEHFNRGKGLVSSELEEKYNTWIAWLEKQGEHHIACSEEQMKVLNEVLNFAANHESPYWNDYIFGTLNSLIKQLKKLKYKVMKKKYVDNDTLDDKDEEIRKALINVFATHKDYEMFFGVSVEDIRVWLENQGDEQKPTWSEEDEYTLGETIQHLEELEPKFKVGDWIILDRPVLITKVEDMPYNTHQYWTSDGTWFGDATKTKLWTIQDAKNGDILVSKSNQPFIYNGKMDSRAIGSHGGVLFDGTRFICGSDDCNWTENKFIHPATKEQCDLLFSKMKEAGYKLDKNFNVIKI